MWQSRFAADSSVLGKEILINGSTLTIIGVTPKEFEGVSPGYPNELWIPTMMVGLGYRWCNALTDVNCSPLEAIGRLAPGQTLESARAEFTMLSSRVANPESSGPHRQLNPAVGVRAMIGRR
jgi:hypothetical protein